MHVLKRKLHQNFLVFVLKLLGGVLIEKKEYFCYVKQGMRFVLHLFRPPVMSLSCYHPLLSPFQASASPASNLVSFFSYESLSIPGHLLQNLFFSSYLFDTWCILYLRRIYRKVK